MRTKATGLHWQTVCRKDALKDGAFVEFTLATAAPDADPDSTGQPLTGFVFARKGILFAYLNRCPHLGIELNWMPGRFLDVDGHFIQCSTHGALFTPERGDCIAGPCQGDALTALEVVEQDGLVMVRAPG